MTEKKFVTHTNRSLQPRVCYTYWNCQSYKDDDSQFWGSIRDINIYLLGIGSVYNSYYIGKFTFLDLKLVMVRLPINFCTFLFSRVLYLIYLYLTVHFGTLTYVLIKGSLLNIYFKFVYSGARYRTCILVYFKVLYGAFSLRLFISRLVTWCFLLFISGLVTGRLPFLHGDRVGSCL